MPLEGQWARQHAPLVPKTRRELRALVIVCVLTLVVLAVIAWAVIASSAPEAAAGCHFKTIASTMGGATVQVCP